MIGRPRTLQRLLIALASTSAFVLAACGPSLDTLTNVAMESCITARNPIFVSGRGANALDTPLSPEAERLAMKLRYSRGVSIFSQIAEEAPNQVTLVCALDMLSHNGDVDARLFIERYLKHPSPDVATNARLLLDRPIPKGL